MEGLVPPKDPCPKHQKIEWLKYLQYCLQCEMSINCKYRKQPIQSNGINYIYHYCTFPGCKASFKFILDDDQYQFEDCSHNHIHQGTLPQSKYNMTSVFLRDYIHEYFLNGGTTDDAIRESYMALNIPETHNFAFLCYNQ